MGCCLIADAEIQFPAGVKLYKNPSDAGDSPVFLEPRNFWYIAQCQWNEFNQ